MIAKVALGYCPCGNPCENPDTGECASCAAARRKAERRKAPDLKRHIPKVSLKRKVELDQYSVLRQTFLLRKWCVLHGKPCLPDQVHHQKGKVGFCDDIAREKGIPALLDIRYWIPVCQEAHDWITEHSKEAIEQGYSIQRTI